MPSSSSSEYTTAPSSPQKRKPGRPAKKRGRLNSPERPPPAKEVLTISQALRKFIDKELKIVLTRCDENDVENDSRPSSSLTAEPPVLEVSNIELPLPSPASSIASEPPVLIREMNYSYPRVGPSSVSPLSSEITVQPISTTLIPNHPEETSFQITLPPLCSSPQLPTDHQGHIVTTNATNGEVIFQNGVDQAVFEVNETGQCNNSLVINPEPSGTYQQHVAVVVGEALSIAQPLSEPKPIRSVAAVLPRARKSHSQPEACSRNKLETNEELRFLSQPKFKSGHITTTGFDNCSGANHVVVHQAFTTTTTEHYGPLILDMSHWNGPVENCDDEVNSLTTVPPPPPAPPAVFCNLQTSPSVPPPPPFLNMNTAVAVPNHELHQQSVLQDDSNSDCVIIPEESDVVSIHNGFGSPPPFEDPTSDEEDSDGVEILENPVEDLCHFNALKSTATALFKSPRFIPPKVLWFSCVMFDTKILRDLTAHEQERCQLFNTATIGRMLADTVQNEGHSWPGVAQMDWRKPFIVLDIITRNYTTCGPPGCRPCLRVQEKAAEGKAPLLWDMVIDKECENLAAEMVRLVDANVKTTVMIWGARKHFYSKSWVEDAEGELLLMPTNKDDDVLSVLIFHHEDLTLERGKLIHGPFPDSELWHLQDPDLDYRTLIQVEIKGKPSKPTHLTLHTMKPYIPPEGLPPRSPPCPLVLFPEDGIPVSDEEEDELSDDEHDSNIEDQFDVMDEEEWDDFVSVSRAGSRVGSSSPENRTHNDLRECAERLFQKPKLSPPKITTGQNRNPAQEEGANRISAAVGRGSSIVSSLNNGDAENDLMLYEEGRDHQINANDQLSDIDEAGEEEIGPVVSNSQKQMLLTQEFVISDDESEDDQHQKENGKDDDLEETVLTPPSPPSQVTNTKDFQPQPIPHSKTVISSSREKCDSYKRTNSKQCNGGNINGVSEIPGGVPESEGRVGGMHKKKVNTERNQSPSQQQDPISFSENSNCYNFSSVIDEL